MDNLNFQCGNCGNLMAVSPESLGQQVRCPHCQQVVHAPVPPEPIAAAEAPNNAFPEPVPTPPVEAHEPEFQMPAVSELESIFGKTDSSSDSLFDDPPPVLGDFSAQPGAEVGQVEPTLSYHPDGATPGKPAEATRGLPMDAFSDGQGPEDALAETTTSVVPEALANAIP